MRHNGNRLHLPLEGAQQLSSISLFNFTRAGQSPRAGSHFHQEGQ